MPPRPDTYETIEKKIQEAIVDVQNRNYPTVADAARAYDVPCERLRRRLLGTKSKQDRVGHTLLNPRQTKALKEYISRCDKLFMSPLVPQLVGAAQRILDLDDPSGKANPVGKNWVARWLAQNPDARRKRQRPQELARLAANKVETYQHHFDELERVIDEFGIQPGDTYNMDETGVRMGIGGSQWVVTMRIGEDAAQSASNTNRESCTLIECVSDDGWVLSPFIILSAKVHLEKWYTNTQVPDNYSVALSDTGYNNDEISIEWMKHFEKSTCARQKGVHRLLIFDGFGSHGTHELIEFCDKHAIVLFSLPPHTSHNLQPLDVGVFQAYKKNYRTVVEKACREGCTDFNKLEFLHAINGVRDTTFNPRTIKAWHVRVRSKY